MKKTSAAEEKGSAKDKKMSRSKRHILAGFGQGAGFFALDRKKDRQGKGLERKLAAMAQHRKNLQKVENILADESLQAALERGKFELSLAQRRKSPDAAKYTNVQVAPSLG